ncbi:MAG TPA: adenylyltransferase/cytidyltransferase family protein [Candidatus Acidoferrales bacterium]|nr:adenylyltransferase/cytidyltransferase family protein [Candidatus Acidoferrales bacterium]
MNTREKILPLDTLVERLEGERRRGRRIVMANGCFDLLHAGHIRFLEGAQREGDVLVVAVNSDASERRLKGPGRPVLPAEGRAQLVAAVGVVDYVVVFDESDVGPLLERLRPDVHAKGTDYTAESVPESSVARQLGIGVAIVGDPKRHSSADLIERIRKASHG